MLLCSAAGFLVAFLVLNSLTDSVIERNSQVCLRLELFYNILDCLKNAKL